VVDKLSKDKSMTLQKTNVKYFFSLIAFIIVLFGGCQSTDSEADASGVFEAQEVIISSESSGKILLLAIEEGQTLKAGQNIGHIDCQNLGFQKSQIQASIEALAQKQNNATPQTDILQQQLTTQQNQVATQKEQLRVLQKEYVRFTNLLKDKATTAKQLDDIEGQVEILKKQIITTESQTNVLRQQIKSQQAQVAIQNRGIMSERKPLQERIAQVNDQLKRCVITNPQEGTVLVKYATTNEITAPGKALYKIADLSNLILRAYITGDQLSKIKLNQSVKVLIDNGKEPPKEMAGTITYISSKAEFTPKTIQTKDERANLVYATKIKVKNDGFLKIGMYGEVKF
jgi:HlyD family secretion protein